MLQSKPVKRIISIAFLAAVVLLGARTCSTESAECSIRFELGEAAGVESLEVRLFRGKESTPLGHFRKFYGDTGGPLAVWPLTVAPGPYRLEGELRTATGLRSFGQEVRLEDGHQTYVHLERHLKQGSH